MTEKRERTRPLSPRTLLAYENILRTAFQSDSYTLQHLDKEKVSTWSNSSLNSLKCAIRWARKQQGLPPKDVLLEDAIQPRYTVTRQPYSPVELELERLEKQAMRESLADRAAVLLLLFLGLRAEEYYTLPRKNIERALNTGVLTFVRKGGREHSLDTSKVQNLLQDLLLLPAKTERGFGPVRHKKWEKVGEIYSAGKPQSQYHVIRRIILRVTKQAGLSGLSPHKLRHAFATRLNRDGASAFTIQAALNHKNMATTSIYTHASTSDVAKFLRGPNGKKD